LGPVNSGKTVLWYQLKNDEFRESHTSLSENIGTFIPKQLQDQKVKVSPHRFVDLPGHGSLRWKLQNYLDQTKGIVFVVDSSEGDTHLTSATQQLFEILTHAPTVKSRVPILIACNKNDEEGMTTDDIKEQLEALLEKSRHSQGSMADLQDSSHIRAASKLGREGLPFKFDHSP